MGNTVFTSNAQWNFTLDHDQPGQNLAFIAGNPLKGKVIVKVKKDLPPTKLLLQLKGAEKSKVVYGSGKHKKAAYATRVICGATAVLRQEGKTPIRAGTYVFPFEIMLPASLPSSMEGQGNRRNHSNCSIYYRLSVDAHYNGKTVSKVAKRYFNVASTPLPDELVPAIVAPKSFRLESFGMNRGTLSIGARVIDIHVGRGTDLMIYLACRNDATASIYRVEIELIQNLSWYAHSNRSNSDTRTIAHLPDVDLPGIVRGKKDKEQVREQIRQGGVQPHELQGLYNALQSKENMVILNIPEGCRDTYNGPLIKIKHYLKITMYTKSLISNPSIEIPLRIGFPPQVGRRQFPQPLAPPQPRVQSPPAWSEDPRNLMPSPFAPPAFAPSSQQQYSVPAMASAQPLPVAQPYQSQVRNRNMTIPMAEAVLIPTEDAIQAPMASAPPEAMVLGGNAFYSEVESSMEIPTLAPPSSGPTIGGLLEEMVFSINDFEIIDGKLRDENWAHLLSLITPDEFGSIIAHVNLDMDQPRVAAVLATNIGDRFTCEHGRAAAKNAAEWNRATTVQRILPHCVDIVTNHGIIREVLTDWEQTVTSSDFELVIRQRGGC